jgi:hypothetical protein
MNKIKVVNQLERPKRQMLPNILLVCVCALCSALQLSLIVYRLFREQSLWKSRQTIDVEIVVGAIELRCEVSLGVLC